MKLTATLKPALAILCLSALPALAANHEVHMLNKGERGVMVFEPAFVQAEPGDTITFIPTDKSHNVESLKGMIPEGVEAFKSKVNEEFVLNVEVPGLYAVKCTPHVVMGMVGLIQVGGDAHNYDSVAEGKLPKKARERMDEDLASVTR
ncbi:pseudoazurin [Paracoccus halophilus]|uniref:Pseudoazurin n=1 Tax=Paracoccus halophilus TaxID=376733 RepID=A0A099F3X8_9RHOB|nr:pseudoazurin [Paracoccus halophilus]KGJ05420.1 pseudoazurin [Paracoccus halophilus]SFA49131.1 pseudoazurin [Paracoccus halophilus]